MGFPRGVSRITYHGGIPATKVTTPLGDLLISDHAAQALSWIPAGQTKDVFWLSKTADHAVGKPTRGGDFDCGLWFGKGVDGARNPMHGHLRDRLWGIVGLSAETDFVSLKYELLSTPDIAILGQSWKVQTEYILSSNQLKLVLTTVNTGSMPITVERMRHPYFHISSRRTTYVEGLEQFPFTDSLTQREHAPENAPVILVGEHEINRIYQNAPERCALVDSGYGRKIVVRKENAPTNLVWTIGGPRAKQTPDFDDDASDNTVSLEAGFARVCSRIIQPQDADVMCITYSIESLL